MVIGSSLIAIGAAGILGLAPLLRGTWDLWAQTLIHGVSLALVGKVLWECFDKQAFLIPRRSALLSLVLLWGLLTLATAHSSVLWLSLQEHGNWINYFLLWYFCAITPQTHSVYLKTIVASGVALVVLGFFLDKWPYHYFSSSLINPNVLAGFLIMTLPLSLHLRHQAKTQVAKICTAMAAGILAVGILLTRSTGAMMALALAGTFVLLKNHHILKSLLAGLSLSLALWLFLEKMQASDLLNRWHWWTAAGRMLWEQPLLGIGPGTFEHHLPRYDTYGLASAYAHNWFLQWTAECGFPAGVVLLGILFWFLRRTKNPFLLCSLLAILLQNLVDYNLFIPANALTFWSLLAIGALESPRMIFLSEFRARLLGATGLAVVLLGFQAAARPLFASRHLEFGKYHFDHSDWELTEEELEHAIVLNPLSDSAYHLAATLAIKRYHLTKNVSFLYQALMRQKSAVRVNPLAASSWYSLSWLQQALGENSQARESYQQARKLAPRLKPPSYEIP